MGPPGEGMLAEGISSRAALWCLLRTPISPNSSAGGDTTSLCSLTLAIPSPNTQRVFPALGESQTRWLTPLCPWQQSRGRASIIPSQLPRFSPKSAARGSPRHPVPAALGTQPSS